MKKKYTLFANGNIYTVDKNNPKAEAVVTEKGKIVFVGKSSDAKRFLGFSNYDYFDLKGNAMLPGFIDSHLHVLIGARNLANIDLSAAKDKVSFQRILREFYLGNKRDWYFGGNWNEENFIERRLPDKSWIDEIIPDLPVFLTRSDLHMGVANSAALKIAKISKTTVNPPGGLIEKSGKTGEPTGILQDTAMTLLFNLIPRESSEIKKKYLLNGIKYLNSFGVTSVHDLAMEDYFSSYEEIFSENNLSLRINYVPGIESVDDFSEFKIEGEKYNHFLKRIAVKAFADGSLGSSTAWFFEPYGDDPANRGLPTEIFSTGKLKKLGLDADNNNIILLIHAIGDRANHEILNLLEGIVKENGGKNRRNRIEHCQHLNENDVNLFAVNEIIASMQPYHLAFDGRLCERKIGKKRLNNCFPIASLAKRKVRIIFGSDWPVVIPSPLKGIAAAVTRELDNSNKVFLSDQKISAAQAVEAYTINAAYAEGDEERKGKIEKGKLADFVILGGDIFNIQPEEIKDVKVNATIIDGKIVFENY